MLDLTMEQRTFRITVAYDGTAYEGWQLQPARATIQGSIEAALGAITGGRVVVVGASRTDSGVHARGQVASFSWAATLEPARIPAAINSRLPADIRVLDCIESPRFDARRDCLRKSYTYTVNTRRIADPFALRFAAHTPARLDETLLAQAAGCLHGDLDQSAFTLAETLRTLGSRGGTRTVSSAEWAFRGSMAVFTITADGFLRHSIRTMVGAMIEVGRRRLSLEDLRRAIGTGKRSMLRAPTMPAKGLCLENVEY
ncbi:MAG: tRNA pseudouridine(38-40) synthase TruA [Acidobacteria bacterium]|nr:tRNA pseudouridine(38-40) synthase TruA [Acidobacteriota bacterium]